MTVFSSQSFNIDVLPDTFIERKGGEDEWVIWKKGYRMTANLKWVPLPPAERRDATFKISTTFPLTTAMKIVDRYVETQGK